MKLNYNQLAFYQQCWKESKNISPEKSQGLIELADVFIGKVKANRDNVDGVVLLYPEDCSNYEVFKEFAEVMSAYVTERKENGLKMDGWLCDRKECVEIRDSICRYIGPKINIESVTDENILYWAFLYWVLELDSFEEELEYQRDDERIKYLCNSIVEANVILLEIYNKLITIPEFDVGQLGNVEWMNKFWE